MSLELLAKLREMQEKNARLGVQINDLTTRVYEHFNKMQELAKRLEALETKRGPGRPPMEPRK